MTETHNLTEERAVELMGVLARSTVAITRAEAAREAQIQRAKAACEADTQAAREELGAAEKELDEIIMGNPELFRKPRMRSCVWGEYGVRSSTKTMVADTEATIRWLRANGYGDLVEVKESIKLGDVGKLVDGGEKVAGVRRAKGIASKYVLDMAVLTKIP